MRVYNQNYYLIIHRTKHKNDWIRFYLIKDYSILIVDSLMKELKTVIVIYPSYSDLGGLSWRCQWFNNGQAWPVDPTHRLNPSMSPCEPCIIDIWTCSYVKTCYILEYADQFYNLCWFHASHTYFNWLFFLMRISFQIYRGLCNLSSRVTRCTCSLDFILSGSTTFGTRRNFQTPNLLELEDVGVESFFLTPWF